MKNCKVDNCKNKHLAKGYCSKHYQQLRNSGRIYRTIYDRNQIIDRGDYLEICLYNNKCLEIARTQINKDDLNKVKKYKWRLMPLNYVIADLPRQNGKKLMLHQLILGKKNGVEIDHADRNPLNNRRKNLRYATRQENNMNTSGIGVSWHKQTKKWRAYIMLDYKQISLGLFNDVKKALVAREEAELKYFGKFAKSYAK